MLLKTVQFHSKMTTKKPRPLKTVPLQNTPRYHFSRVKLERKKPRPRQMKKQLLKKGNVMETSARKEKGFNLLRIRLQFPSWNYKGRLFCKYLVNILLLRVKLGQLFSRITLLDCFWAAAVSFLRELRSDVFQQCTSTGSGPFFTLEPIF